MVWFKQHIPRYAFIAWLIFKQHRVNSLALGAPFTFFGVSAIKGSSIARCRVLIMLYNTGGSAHVLHKCLVPVIRENFSLD